MILTVIREHHWPPEVVDALFLDAKDHHGLVFWYNDVVETHKNIKR